ncbi:MAG TPA: TerB N-terminal domain-containing protein [Thermomicrobiales bacterium]|nr:TerB N-terminal domain-containing protein [Thermomicrobiales bacterium]
MDKLLDLFRKRGAPPQLTIFEDPDTGTIHVGLVEDVDELADFDLRRTDGLVNAEFTTDASWFAPGESVTIRGITIDSGYIYVGGSLRTSPYDGNDASLINPAIPTSQKTKPNPLSYWPRYDGMSRSQRAAYLTWLAGGRNDPQIDIGYVFVFFYGLELFVLANPTGDPRKVEHLPGIRREIERLLTIHGANSSFRHYASGLLNIIDLMLIPTIPFTPPDPPELHPNPDWQFPRNLPMTIGQFLANKMPLPPEWALAWVWYSPEIRLRAPALHCRDEFSRLFIRRYTERFPAGIKIRPGKNRIRAHYTPANRSYGLRTDMATDIPNVFSQRGPVTKLAQLTNEVTVELEGYNRWLVRNSGKKGSFAELAYLPPDLIDDTNPARQSFLTWAESTVRDTNPALIDAADLIARWRGDDTGKLTAAQADAYLRLTAELGFGVEPDPRFNPRKLSASIPAILFRLPANAPQEPGDGYRNAAMLVHLAAAVAIADGRITRSEAGRIGDVVARTFDLSAAERERLFAHLLWLSTTKITLSGFKTRLLPLDEEDRAFFGDTLIDVAAADGFVSPAEVTMLGRIFALLGLDPDSVSSRLHATLTGSRPRTEPGTLDARTIDRIRAESHDISAILGDIFADDDAGPASPESSPAPGHPTIPGLDVAHSGLLVRLGQRENWPRADFDALATEFGVMPGGAIDLINDVAFDIIGDPIIEGDDVLTINRDLIQDLYP